MTVALVLDPRFREHRTPPGHPERPERIAASLDEVEGGLVAPPPGLRAWRAILWLPPAMGSGGASAISRTRSSILTQQARAPSRSRCLRPADSPWSGDRGGERSAADLGDLRSPRGDQAGRWASPGQRRRGRGDAAPPGSRSCDVDRDDHGNGSGRSSGATRPCCSGCRNHPVVSAPALKRDRRGPSEAPR